MDWHKDRLFSVVCRQSEDMNVVIVGNSLNREGRECN